MRVWSMSGHARTGRSAKWPVYAGFMWGGKVGTGPRVGLYVRLANRCYFLDWSRRWARHEALMTEVKYLQLQVKRLLEKENARAGES